MKERRMSIVMFLFLALSALTLIGDALAQAPAQTDYSKVQVEPLKLAPNFYGLNGQGGAIGVLTGPEGVLMVDSQFAPLTEKIVAAVKQVSNTPIKFLINTHVHGDHTGGNENLGKMGVTIFAREELRNRLAHPATGAAAPPAAMPVVHYSRPPH